MNPFVTTVVGLILTASPASPVIVLLGSKIPPSEQSFLKALGEIESGNNDYVVGKLGERSRYQIRRETWSECSNIPFTASHFVLYSSAAAINYSNILCNRYKQEQGVEPDNISFYIMWNWGFSKYKRVGFNTKRVPYKVLDAAHRFQNLVFKYQNQN